MSRCRPSEEDDGSGAQSIRKRQISKQLTLSTTIERKEDEKAKKWGE